MPKNITAEEQKIIDQATEEKTGRRYRSLADNWTPRLDSYPRAKEFAKDNKVLRDLVKPLPPRD